ncbi:MAG TPA: L-rhamnose mutarotase [Chloroflexota bacterium]|nr:L-rhamnose mutarotase [Chloroflexota bacterium]
MQRKGMLIGVQSKDIDEYERIHKDVWPEVLATIHDCNIRNYSIFRLENMLFAYYEYIGDDYQADMARMAADPKTREWWSITDPMQVPVEEAGPGEWWAALKEVFHVD